ncbi:protein brown isoform X2 [Wyeomyia smithii]|uniref:protein brown isoform X2 n=1 Tax=Wyeomyia smithii TaxID=174621 RepID=UPI00246805B4|nr:protein brown isoform X2 [Wyeomyia smithii]
MQLDVKLNQTPRTSAARESSSVLLQWKDLSVSVASRSFWKRRNKLEEKHYILKDANGALRSGNLMAAMGASGSGKTTMLAAVSMRMTADYVQGQVFVNGLSVGHSEMKRLSGFVPQFEISVNSLTVREQLTFVSKLKGVPLTQMRTVIRELNLEKCEQTRISHLSGGERRKINLAGELLTEPPILFCDEPTTGLDSFSALSVLKSLQKLATVHGKAVICTIHHPASAVFECFSDVILLRQGQVIFQGPTMEASSFFNSIQFPLPVNCNPADHYFKLVCDTKNDAELSLARQARRKLVREFHTRNVRDKCFTLDHHRDDKEPPSLLVNPTMAAFAPWHPRQRTQHSRIRDSNTIVPVTPTNQTAIQDIRGALFLMLCELLYTISYAVFYMFPQELPLLRREVGEQTYRLSAYYAHKALLTVPKAFFESFLFVGIIYGCVKFATGFATYLGMATVCSFASLLAVAYGYLFSCICGSVELSIEYANIIFLLYALLGGLYLNVRAFPVSKFVSFFFFASEGISVYYWRSVGNITCAEPGRNSTTCLPNGQAVLEDAGYRTTLDAIYGNYLLMVVEILLVHFVAYLSLRRFVRRVGFY